MTALWPRPGQACGASPLPLHLSEDVAISARDQSLGLGAEGGEWITEVTLLVTVPGAWLKSDGLSCCATGWFPRGTAEGDEVVGFAESGSSSSVVRSSWSFNSESLRRGSVSLPWFSSLNLSQPMSPGFSSLWSKAQIKEGKEKDQNYRQISGTLKQNKRWHKTGTRVAGDRESSETTTADLRSGCMKIIRPLMHVSSKKKKKQ